jgi:hypothetical protein
MNETLSKVTVLEFVDECGQWKFGDVTIKSPKEAVKCWLEDSLGDKAKDETLEQDGGTWLVDDLVRAYECDLNI